MARAEFFEHENFGGASFTLTDANWYDPDLGDNGWNDHISSIKEYDGAVIAHEHTYYDGAEVRFDAGNYRNVGTLWNDEISSLYLVA